MSRPTTPCRQRPQAIAPTRFGLIPFRSPLLRESRFLSLPRATKMFQFARLPPTAPMDSVRGTRALPRVGFPIRKSPDQSLFSSSPRLIAAVHVLHRLLVPRHPPCALVLLIHDSPSFENTTYRYAVFKVPRDDVPLETPDGRAPRCAPGGARRTDAGLSKLNSMRPAARVRAPGSPCRHRFQASPCCDPECERDREVTLQARARRPAGTPAVDECHRIPRKEVIQPQLPLRLPCYDFTPVTDSTFDRSLPCGLGHGLRVSPASVV